MSRNFRIDAGVCTPLSVRDQAVPELKTPKATMACHVIDSDMIFNPAYNFLRVPVSLR